MGIKTRKIALNTIAQVAGKILTTAISLVMVGYLTRYLGASGFGRYTTVIAYLTFFNVFADLGLYMIVVRELSKVGAKCEKILGNALSFRGLTALALLLPAPFIALALPYPQVVKQAMFIGAGAFFFLSLHSITISIFQARLRMDQAVLSDVIGRSAILALVIVFIRLDFGLLAVISAVLIGNLIQFLVTFVLANRFIRIKPRFDFKIWKQLIYEAWPLAIAGILTMTYFKFDTILLSVLPLGKVVIKGIGEEVIYNNMASVGIYGASYKVLEILVTFPAMFMGAVFPVLTGYISSGDKRVRDTFSKSFNFLAITAFPMVVGILILAPQIMTTIAGEEFILSALPLRILIFAVACSFFGNLAIHTVIAFGFQRKMIWVTGFGAAVNIGSNLIAIPILSYIGAASTTVLTESLVLILTGWIVYKYANLLPPFKILPKTLLASLVMGAVLFVLIKINLFLLIGLGVLIYIIVLYLIKGFSKQDVLSIMNKGY